MSTLDFFDYLASSDATRELASTRRAWTERSSTSDRVDARRPRTGVEHADRRSDVTPVRVCGGDGRHPVGRAAS